MARAEQVVLLAQAASQRARADLEAVQLRPHIRVRQPLPPNLLRRLCLLCLLLRWLETLFEVKERMLCMVIER